MSSLRRFIKAAVVAHDLLMIASAFLGAYWLNNNLDWFSRSSFAVAARQLPWVLVLQLLVCYFFGLYRGVWRFASIPDLLRIVKSITVGTMIISFAMFLNDRLANVPRSVFPIYALLAIFLLGGSRFTYRWLKDYRRLFQHGKRILIVGAGSAGEGLARDMIRRSDAGYHPVAFIDDNLRKKGREIHGVRVLGTIKDIPEISRQNNIELIIIAIPSLGSKRLREVVEYCEEVGVPSYILPSMPDVIEGRVNINSLRKLSLEDLLGREPISLDWQSIKDVIQEKTVLVTGAGGSIGSELCRQIAKLNPGTMILVEHSEYNLYAVSMELGQLFPGINKKDCLIDVKDKGSINQLFRQYAVDVVFHAAAYKHVPLLEDQLLVAIRNNIIGTMSVAEAAANHQVKKFILISTDKAVNPANVMGLTKRAAEVFCQYFNTKVDMQMMIVRFGNVLGSTGSVVPLFQKQLAQGGPLTVTHSEVERFFMTIPEACQLILQAATLGTGSEIFVLDMGEPIKIKYLAEQVIKLSGKTLDEIQITYTGLRPGEKLFEELFYAAESMSATSHSKLLKAICPIPELEKCEIIFTELMQNHQMTDKNHLIQLLAELVPGYRKHEVPPLKVVTG